MTSTIMGLLLTISIWLPFIQGEQPIEARVEYYGGERYSVEIVTGDDVESIHVCYGGWISTPCDWPTIDAAQDGAIRWSHLSLPFPERRFVNIHYKDGAARSVRLSEICKGDCAWASE